MSIFLDYLPLATVLITAILGYLFNKKLNNDKEKDLKKRQVYESFLNSITLNLFEDGSNLLIDPSQHYASKEVNKIRLQVINDYEKVKLWGSKEVIKACYDLFQINIDSQTKTISQDDMRKSYYELINAMRKDLGMKTNFKIDESNIQIIKFDRVDLFTDRN